MILIVDTSSSFLKGLIVLCVLTQPVLNWINMKQISFLQCTTYDLLEKGMEVHIVADAVSSRRFFLFFIFSASQHCFLLTIYILPVAAVYMHACVAPHSQTDRLFALSRLKQSGAYLTTTEAVLLQLVQDAKHPNFKEVLTTPALCLSLKSISFPVGCQP